MATKKARIGATPAPAQSKAGASFTLHPPAKATAAKGDNSKTLAVVPKGNGNGNANGNGAEVTPPMPKDFALVLSEEDPTSLLSKFVVFNEGRTGLSITDGCTLEELVPIIGNFQTIEGHVQFYIGDAMLYGRAKFKERFAWAMEKTGRSEKTVRNYETIAAAFPEGMRSERLTFTHYEKLAPAVARIEMKEVKAILKEAEGTKTKAPLTVKELAAVVKVRAPKPAPKRAPAKKTAGTGRKPAKKGTDIKTQVYHSCTPDELGAQEALFEALDSVNGILGTNPGSDGRSWLSLYVGSVKPEIPGMDNASKKKLLASLKMAHDLYKSVEFKTGY